MTEPISKSLREALELHERMFQLAPVLEKAGDVIWERLSRGGKMILMGNGGSAADAQHISTEMVGRFEFDHAPIPAIALTTNTSLLTAISNDFGFGEVFYRQMVSLMKPEDVVIAISTSGNSDNIHTAVEYARENRVPVIGLLGKGGGTLKSLTDPCIIVPSDRTCRIQECHILIGHILCEIIEKRWMKSQTGNRHMKVKS